MFQDEKKFGEVQVDLKPWQRVLLDAANLLERDGWCQHRTRNDRGERCALGALTKIGHYMPFENALDAYMEAEGAVIRFVGGSVAPWNDQPGRTREEVCAVLRQAAAI